LVYLAKNNKLMVLPKHNFQNATVFLEVIY